MIESLGIRHISAVCIAAVLLMMIAASGYVSDVGADEAMMAQDAGAASPIESPVTHDRVGAPVDVEPTTAAGAGRIRIAAGELPATFDLRENGCVTAIKNQGASPSCWVFAAYGSLESTILVAGGAALDLSENHVKNWHGYDSGPNSGGNQYMTEAYLSRWDGPVSETDDPYHDTDDFPSPGGPPQCYVREVLMLDTPAEIKECLITYGAVAGGMNGDMTHYDAASNTYYFDGSAQPAHGVTMVGWDDDKVVPGAPGPGAWLIKNSWGADWGDDGYVWLSYYDSCGGQFGFCFCDAVAPDTYQKIYYYDDFGNVGSLAYNYACNAFAATSDQELVAVRFWTKADGAGYEIRIYDSLNGDALTGLLGSVTGTCMLAGAHTVDLPAPIHLTKGNDFFVSVRITDGGAFPMACDWAVSGYTGSSGSRPNQSYFSIDGIRWTDLVAVKPTANFCIRALVTMTSPPEITVLGNGISIDDGDMASSPTDGTFFGTAVQGGPPVNQTFTVQNDGTGTLGVDRVAIPNGFVLTNVPATTLDPGASDTFSVQLSTDTVGTKNGHIVVMNDDNDEHPFNFAVSGIVVGPEIAVGGNNWLIVNGDDTPWLADGTDFGIVALGGAPISRTFVVRNEGNAALTLGTVTAPTGFTVTKDLPPSLDAGVADTFTVQLDTAVAGTKTGDISFLDDDADENPFYFTISGVVTDEAEVTVLGNGTLITDGDTTPSMDDHTNVGSVVVGGLAISRTFTVRNDGALPLTLGPVLVPGGFTLVEGLSPTLLPGASDTFTIRLETTIAGIKSGDISFSTNDSDENPFHFRITGRVAGFEEPIVFPDSNLKWVVEETLGIRNPTPTDMLALTSLWGWGERIHSYEGLQYAKNAVSLHLGGGPCADISPLAGLTHLTELWLDHSPVSDISALSGLRNLAFLDIGDTKVSDVSALAGLTNLVELRAVSTEIGDILPLSELANLTTLRLVHNRITRVTVSGLPNLTEMDLSLNQISVIVPGSGWTNLTSLDLTCNYVHDISGLAPLTNLRTLNMAMNDVDDITPLAGMTKLEFLSLFFNEFGDLSPLSGLKNLKFLDVHGTYASNLSPLAGLSRLETLHAGMEHVSDVSPLAGLTNLTTLDLGNNDIVDVSPLASLTKMVHLSLHWNRVADISPLADMTNLTELDISLNRSISDISVLSRMTDLTLLKAGDNRIHDISPLAGLTKLTELHVGGNQFDDVAPLSGLTNLTVLHLHNVRSLIRDISFLSQFTDLTTLYLNRNAITDVSVLAQLSKLVYLDLTMNQISDISPLSTVSGLETLALRQNPLNAEAYAAYIPLIHANNPRVKVTYDLPSLAEITVLGNGVLMVDGDTTPDACDGTDFGSVLRGDTPPTRSFIIRNDGTETLVLDWAELIVPDGFSVEGLGDTWVEGLGDYGIVEPGQTRPFTLDLDTAESGIKAGDFSFRSNDHDEMVFNFWITGTVIGADPDITVLGNGIPIGDGDTTPSAEDGTDFGSVMRGSPPVSHTFTVRNDGTSILTFGPPSEVPTGFTWTAGWGATLAPGESSTFTIRLDTNVSGTKTGEYVFNNNDPNENPFHFRITGTVVGGDPEITVLGNGIPINDGDTTPNMEDGTDFSTVLRGSEPVSHMFVVRNDGTGMLTFERWTTLVPDGFRWYPEGRDYSIAPGESNTFTVLMDTAEPGIKIGDFSVSNNDPNENPFNFTITGTVVDPNPEIVVLGNGISISNGDTTPSTADGTDFGTISRGSVPVSHMFIVRNDGKDMLTFSMFGPSTVVPSGFTWKGGPRDLPPGESDTMTIQLDTDVSGTKTGEFSFSNNDQDENPFHFRITGTVVDAGPEITVLGNGISVGDGDTTPSVTDGTDFGTVSEGTTPVIHTFTVRNDGIEPLTLGTPTVPIGFTLTDALPTSLAPGASGSFTIRIETASVGTKTGEVVFANNDSDENPFNFQITGTVVGTGSKITVLGSGLSIGDGDRTPSADDGTNFGIVLQYSTPIVRTFTVRNDGSETLLLGTPTAPTGFELQEGLSTDLGPGASDTFTIRLDTAVIGTKTGDVVFAIRNGDESLFSFRIVGVVTVPGVPEIAVLGNGRSIADGDSSPHTTDGTHFGSVRKDSLPVSHIFIVRNNGTDVLVLGPVAVPTGFTLTEELSTSLAPGAMDTFTVRLDTAVIGTKIGDVIFANSDGDENPFNFRITGTVTP